MSRRRRAHAALRHRGNWVQLAKFCVVGGIGYVVNLAVYTILIHQGLHYLLAATCSFLVAVDEQLLAESTLDLPTTGETMSAFRVSSSWSSLPRRSARTCSSFTS